MALKLVDKRTLSRTDWDELIHKSVGAVCSRRGFVIGGVAYLAAIDSLLAASFSADVSLVFNSTIRNSFIGGQFSTFEFASASFELNSSNSAIYDCFAPIAAPVYNTGAFCWNEVENYYYAQQAVQTTIYQQEVATFEHEFMVERAGNSQHWRVSSVAEAYTSYAGA